MSGPLADQVALVTGAGRGFGRAIAERFAAAGARLALVARSSDQLDEVAAAITSRGGVAVALAGDVTRQTDVERIVRAAGARLGAVSLLVNNAGTPGPFGPIGTVDPAAWWAAQHVHQLAPLLFASAVIPAMRARGGGRIINISAKAGVVVAPNLSAYCVGKAAQNRLTEHIDAEGKADGIRAFSLQPGMVVTALAEETAASPEAQQWLPGMTGRINALRGTEAGTRDLAICAETCMKLASGRYDALAGRYLDIAFDLEAMLREESAK
jgi:NAD(P)-dependent dehydrogenase (short-subunit alcohol dehydrogenase family)